MVSFQRTAASIGIAVVVTLTTGTVAGSPSAADPLRAGTISAPRTTISGTVSSGTTISATSRVWLSGASSNEAASGQYGVWRRSTVQIGGTWDDNNDAQVNMHTICPGGPWARWSKALDVAVGAIDVTRGETWAAAARGAYDARWRTHLLRVKTCWGTRDQAKLYLRFAHEMNLPNSWRVRGGEEADFVKAITRYSTLRYQILPRAKIVLCPNDRTDGSLNTLDIRKLWPGKDSRRRLVANVYAVDSYNGYGLVRTRSQFLTKINSLQANGAPLGIEAHRRFAAAKGVPFAISEWSNNGDPADAGRGGESPVFVREFNAWARAHAGSVAKPRAGQVLYEIHFNLWTQFSFWPRTVQPTTAATYRSLHWGR